MAFIIDGKEFNTQREIAEHYGIDYLTFKTRVQRWGDIEKAALTPITKKGRSKQECIVNGINFDSIAEASRFYGVNLSSVRDKIRKNNCSVEKAIHDLLIDKIIINGLEFKNVGEVCKYFKISRATINKYIEKGCSIEKAVYLIIKKREEMKNTFVFRDKIYNNLDDICKEYNIKKASVGVELSKGLSLLEALNKIVD